MPPPAKIDVTANGITTDNSGATNSAAWEVLRTANAGYKVTYYFPGNSDGAGYQFALPIWLDQDSTRLVGDGSDYSIIESNSCYPVVITGVTRNPTSNILDSSNFVSLSGILTIGGDGFATKGDNGTCTLVAPGMSASFGPILGGWAGLRQVHFGWYFKYQTTGKEPLWGLRALQHSRPIFCRRQGNGFLISVCFADGLERYFNIPHTYAQNEMVAIDFQIDLTTNTITAWVAGIQVTPDLSQMGSDWSTNIGGFSFINNDYLHFRIGGEGVGLECSDFDDCYDYSGNNLGGSVYPDIIVYGFVIHTGLVYKNLGVGQALARIDNASITDGNRWVNGSNILWCFYPNTDTADAIISRCLQFICYSDGATSYQCMLALDPQSAQISSSVGPNSIRDLSLISVGPRSITLMIGLALDQVYERLYVQGGAIAIGAISLGANYQILIRDCVVGGYESAIYLCVSTALIQNLNILRPGHVAVRFKGCDINFEGCLVRGNPPSDGTRRVISIHTGNDGGFYRIISVGSDFEDGINPTECTVYAEGHNDNAPTGHTVLILDKIGGSCPAGAVGVKLVSLGSINSGTDHLGGALWMRAINIGGVSGTSVIVSDNTYWQVFALQEGSIPNTFISGPYTTGYPLGGPAGPSIN